MSGMATLTKTMTHEAPEFYAKHAAFNQEYDGSVGTLQYFAAEAKDMGIACEERALRERQARFCRKYGVKEHEARRKERVMQYAEDTWALERYFAEHKAPMSGMAAATVEKAFTTSAIQGAFPIWFASAITEGIMQASILDRLVGDTIPTNSGVANHTELASAGGTALLNTPDPMQQSSEIGEGTRATQVIFNLRERLIKLREFGFEARASYTAVRRTRLPVFQRTLARVGINFQNLLCDFAIDTLIAGDGTSPSNAAITVPAAVAGAPVYADYVNLDYGMPQGYDPGSWIWIMNKQAIVKMDNVPEFKDPLSGFLYQSTGNKLRPFGHETVRWDSTGNTDQWVTTAGQVRILTLNPNNALTEYTEGGVITEAENLISTGWHKVVSRQSVAFGINDPSERVVGTGFA